MATTAAQPLPVLFVGRIGRAVLNVPRRAVRFVGAVGQIGRLAFDSTTRAYLIPLKRGRMIRRQLFPLMTSVGVRSAPIVSLVAILIGAILVLQTGTTIEQFGQTEEIPGMVAIAMTRALGPLMTAIVIISRVGASYTAVLGSMTINDEVMALRTMSINPISYLITPRIVSMIVMVPALVVFSYLLGMLGGGVVALGVYDIGPGLYWDKTFEYLKLPDLFSGVLKAAVFGYLIGVISCHFGLTTGGGSTGLGRNIMVSVVTCLVTVVVADVLLTAFVINHLL